MPAYVKGNILIGNIRPYLKKIWFADKDGGCSADVLVIDVNDDFDSKFVYYALFRDDFFIHMMNGSKGTKMPRGDKTQIMNFSIPNFKFDIQQKIAKVLSTLDAKIELNNRINKELEAMAKTLYDYWFVQFDFPNVDGKPYKSSGGKMVYNEELKREIPEGWEVKKLGKYAEIKRGDLITEKETLEGNVKVVAAGINYSYLHSKYNREKNTITISGSGANAGHINFWREPIFASDCTTIRGQNDIDTIMILHHLYLLQDYIYSQAKGSAQPHVYPEDIKQLYYVIASEKLIDKYQKIILPTNEKIAINQHEIQHLTQLRDFLLPMLMNGQVSVK
ncbi:MAG: restriction endonuclease [Sulfurimonas sp. CG08_land_8_20_14_0_20_36_33]|nr:MAG: restriction endonuclease [Sulfurimonas sp. CG23_combo_of_CG06-09_8_20_14_all_36_33]PIS23675.1 MAG: restriction endonuclease [Sulfurimonas sp. CG08_land_8_20_14_0_20_36_33]PIU34855.1 MAG: restriction endonuclease [Sulfurimonas sp. CG07_land_8_20_14_0_80_36_56]PIV05130.1 MAG: restriction endonuclease [Sulfurimonas sp. CG03_land_8_20_14_0_80_36_25]PIV34905.1 MAG: restriction endonuclease [Sulfurimonas sp. CG02_land_8_20_14_3_00_36_67]PIV59166.1 MAG: restriction endonuclease [Sulfurimonas 